MNIKDIENEFGKFSIDRDELITIIFNMAIENNALIKVLMKEYANEVVDAKDLSEEQVENYNKYINDSVRSEKASVYAEIISKLKE